MKNTTELKEFAQLAQAAYALLNKLEIYGDGKSVPLMEQLKASPNGGFAEGQAVDFTNRYFVLNQFRDENTLANGGFSVNKKRVLSLLVLCVALLNACGQVDLKWSEEVQLSSGKNIIVKRAAKGKKIGEIGGPGGWEQKEMSVEIDAKDSEIFNPPVWRTAYVPVLLDYDTSRKEWLIVATFYTCQGWYDLGRPKLPYVEYRVANDGQWRIVPLDAALIGRKANMLTGVSSGGEPPLVTRKDKAERDSEAAKKYQEVVGSWQSNC